MKKTLLLAGLICLSTSSFADTISGNITSSSFITSALEATGCVISPENSTVRSCNLATSGLTSSSLMARKQEIKQVEVDAYDFIAGDMMTLALEEEINELRSLSPELNELSDHEVVVLMLNSL